MGYEIAICSTAMLQQCCILLFMAYVVTRSEVHGPRSLPSINFQIFLPSTNGLDTVTGFSHALMEVVAASCCYQELSLKNDILERSLSRLSAISSCLLNRL